MPLSPLEAFGGLVALFLLCLPLGWVVVRAIEWAVGHRFLLSVPERGVVAFYASGGLLFALASLPWPIYSAGLVWGLLLAGVLVAIVLTIRDRTTTLRPVAAWMTSAPGAALTLGTLALLAVEVSAVGARAFPNSNDGSFQALYVQLLLRGHTLPWTYEPFANIGIVYPAGATVWLALPAQLWGWPIVAGPVALPVFFLSFSIVGAYCWGERCGGVGAPAGERTGLIFAAFFGLVGSWPRLFIGGSYDFAFSLPLFLVSLGWLRTLAKGPVPRWGTTFALGLLLATLTSMSVAVGETFSLLLVGFAVAFHPGRVRDAAAWTARLGAIVALGLAAVVRSLAGIAAWYSYPGHVLNPIGSPPYAPVAVGPGPTATSPIGDLDPFVPFKPKLSPIPVLSVELAILLAVGLALLALWWIRPGTTLRRVLGGELVGSVTGAVIVIFLFTASLSTLTPPPIGTSLLVEVTSEYENSYLLFIAYQAVALLPIVAAVNWLRPSDRAREPRGSPVSPGSPNGSGRPSIRVPSRGGWVPVALSVFVVATLGVGAYATAADVPGFLTGHLEQFSDVTPADVAALEWAGQHLPDCSRVLAAPYSAAMFLPLYADVRLVFPAYPLSVNLSYYVAVTDLTAGVYDPSTRDALVSLGVTEVVVTGMTSVSYPPLSAAPMNGSADFRALFQEGDASIFLFAPGATLAGCAPT